MTVIHWKSRPEQIARLAVSALLLVVWLSAGCASKPAYRVSQVAFVGASVADVWTTHLALARGSVEANPFMGQSLAQQAAVKGASLGTVLWLADRLEARGHRRTATILLNAIAATYGVIAVRNHRIARRVP